MLYVGVRGGLEVTCWTAKREVQTPGQGRNLDRDFCFIRTRTLSLGPQISGYQC